MVQWILFGGGALIRKWEQFSEKMWEMWHEPIAGIDSKIRVYSVCACIYVFTYVYMVICIFFILYRCIHIYAYIRIFIIYIYIWYCYYTIHNLYMRYKHHISIDRQFFAWKNVGVVSRSGWWPARRSGFGSMGAWAALANYYLCSTSAPQRWGKTSVLLFPVGSWHQATYDVKQPIVLVDMSTSNPSDYDFHYKDGNTFRITRQVGWVSLQVPTGFPRWRRLLQVAEEVDAKPAAQLYGVSRWLIPLAHAINWQVTVYLWMFFLADTPRFCTLSPYFNQNCAQVFLHVGAPVGNPKHSRLIPNGFSQQLTAPLRPKNTWFGASLL